MTKTSKRKVTRKDRRQGFVQEAIDSDKAATAGAKVYHAADVHAWMDRLVKNPKAKRPKALSS